MLALVRDPEMPISIVDLGLVERVTLEPDRDSGRHATIDLLPTFVGCPALDMIRAEVSDRVGDLPEITRVTVNFLHRPGWSPDRITPAGRAELKAHGVTVPEAGCGGTSTAAQPELVGLTVAGQAPPVPCPYCDSDETECESRFGPTRCRMIFYCRACRNSFEHLKPI